jgi:hypothetical protein
MGTPPNLDALYRKPDNAQTRWASFENPTGAKSMGGRANRGAKGHAFDSLKAGDTRVLLDTRACGIIHRIWLTFAERSPAMLRGLRLEMFWDNARSPGVGPRCAF